MHFFKDVRGFDCLVVIGSVSGVMYVALSIIWPSRILFPNAYTLLHHLTLRRGRSYLRRPGYKLASECMAFGNPVPLYVVVAAN